jgi:hypothetical protein
MSNVSKRQGFVLHEALMAVGLAMALVVGVTQLLVVAAQQRRLAGQYAAATQEAGNLMENLVSRAWDDTTSEALASVELSEGDNSQLPDANLSVEVAEEDDGVKRITLRIEWESGPERGRESVRLVGWRFPAEEDGL